MGWAILKSIALIETVSWTKTLSIIEIDTGLIYFHI